MEKVQTVFYRSTAQRQASVLIIDKSQRPRIVVLNGNMTLGRDYPTADCDILLDSVIVSRRHGRFIYNEKEKSYYYVDNNSTNGTYINGQKTVPFDANGSAPYRLNDGDILRIDKKNLNTPSPESVLIVFSRTFALNEKWIPYNLSGKAMVSIGRDEQSTLHLKDIMASRQHAVLSRIGGRWVIYDQDSRNGVSVNGIEINGNAQVFDHDIIKIANTTMILWGNTLFYNTVSGSDAGGGLSVHIVKKKIGRKVLLKDVNFDVQKGDFVLILGGSGAGKTTLVNAILGESKAEGKIILNGLDLYANFKRMKSQIGIVPQFLNLWVNDTVRNTLLDKARLKLGKDYSNADINKHVDDVLNKVGIKAHENKLISELSGGQKKKAAVAAQLIGFQQVFICDEPDSGLDAASRIQQMEILKDISNDGKIVMVITHEPDDAVNLFTKVVVIAKSSVDNAGHLAFYGDVRGALNFFGVKRLQEIMIEINPPYEGGKGHADLYIEKYQNMMRRN